MLLDRFGQLLMPSSRLVRMPDGGPLIRTGSGGLGRDVDCCCFPPVPSDCGAGIIAQYKERACFTDLMANYPDDASGTLSAYVAFLMTTSIDLTFSGFTDGSCDCDIYNTTYTLPYFSSGPSAGAVGYRLSVANFCASGQPVVLSASFACGAFGCTYTASFTTPPGICNYAVSYAKTYATQRDLSALSEFLAVGTVINTCTPKQCGTATPGPVLMAIH